MIVCVRIAPSRWMWISVFGISLYFGSKFFMGTCLPDFTPVSVRATRQGHFSCRFAILFRNPSYLLQMVGRPYDIPNLNTVCSKTFAPLTQSSHLVNSRGE